MSDRHRHHPRAAAPAADHRHPGPEPQRQRAHPQEGFQRHLGISPMAYLRSVRLGRAHADLRAADPARDTVSVIAYRWAIII